MEKRTSHMSTFYQTDRKGEKEKKKKIQRKMRGKEDEREAPHSL